MPTYYLSEHHHLRVYMAMVGIWAVRTLKQHIKSGHRIFHNTIHKLEDLGDDDIALGPHLYIDVKIISLMMVFNRNLSQQVLPLSVVLVRRLQDFLVLQGTTKSTRKKSQQFTKRSKVNRADKLMEKRKVVVNNRIKFVIKIVQ